MSNGSNLERFWAKVDSTADCWLWVAGRSHNGYGSFWADGRSHAAHRWVYEELHGHLPAEIVLDHLCRTPSCVRPDHLDPVTDRVNILRGEAPTAMNARKTRCDHGHLFTEANTSWRKSGSRRCRTCRAAECKRRRARIKEHRA